MAIADWDVINAIAGAGSVPSTPNVFVPQIEGDTNWLATDDAVGDRTVDAITGTTRRPRISSSPTSSGSTRTGTCTAARRRSTRRPFTNVDDNLGQIMDDGDCARSRPPGRRLDRASWSPTTVTSRSRASATASNHPMRQRLSSSPTARISRTATSTTAYEIVDTTPTVVSLFGGTPRPVPTACR